MLKNKTKKLQSRADHIGQLFDSNAKSWNIKNFVDSNQTSLKDTGCKVTAVNQMLDQIKLKPKP